MPRAFFSDNFNDIHELKYGQAEEKLEAGGDAFNLLTTENFGCLDSAEWNDGVERWNGMEWNSGMTTPTEWCLVTTYTYYIQCLVSRASPLSRTRREGVWSNA